MSRIPSGRAAASRATQQGDNVSIAPAIANADLTSRAHLGSQAEVSSERGNVAIRADGETDSGASATVNGFVRGKAGITAAMGFGFATLRTLVEGTVTAAGTPAGAEGAAFDPTAAGVVDTALNRIRMPGHGFSHGHEVIYTPGRLVTGGFEITDSPIGGLKAGGAHFVHVVDADTIELARAPTLALAARGVNPDPRQSLHLAGLQPFVPDAVDETDGTLRLRANGFAPGDHVIDDNDGHGDLDGLRAGATYRLWLADDEFIGLEEMDGTRIALARGDALGTRSFRRAAELGGDDRLAQLTLGRLEGDVLRIGPDGPVASLTAPPTSNTHALAFEDRVLTFDARAAVDATAGTLRLPVTVCRPATR